MKKSSILWIALFIFFNSPCLADGTIYDISFSSSGDDSSILSMKYFGEIYPSVNYNGQDALRLVIEQCSGFSQTPGIELRNHRLLKKIQWQSFLDQFEIDVTLKKTAHFKVTMSRSEVKILFRPLEADALPSAKLCVFYSGNNAEYSACFSPVPAKVRNAMKNSYRPGCPISIKDLSYLELVHWGMDDSTHHGVMIVHKKLALDVLEIFEELYSNKFAIESMRLIDDFDGDDNRSMAANNTSAFNCRRSSADNSRLSAHSYGIAIDINPLLNPYVNSTKILPIQGIKYKNRTLRVKGLIQKGDVCHQAFIKRGWTWGGSWQHSKDFQHFEKKIR